MDSCRARRAEVLETAERSVEEYPARVFRTYAACAGSIGAGYGGEGNRVKVTS
jgi:hypothetical protein